MDMPIYRCSNGKYKIGKKGKCKYSSKEKAERAWKKFIENEGGWGWKKSG